MSATRTSSAPTIAQSAVVELILGAAGLVIVFPTGRSLALAMTTPVAVPLAVLVGAAVGLPGAARSGSR